MDAVKKINNELADLSQSAKNYSDAHPSELNSQIDACSSFVDPIFSSLSNAGIKLQDTGNSLIDVASEMAAGRRKDLGFK